MRRRHGILVVLALLAVFAVACSGSNDDSGGGGGGGGGAATSGGGGGTGIVAQNFAFDPNEVSVSAGSVALTVTNRDSVQHTFTLDDDSSSTDLDPGSTVTIDLDLTKTVGWHCQIHPSMTGTLKVG